MKEERAPLNWLKPPGPVEKGLKIGLLGGSFNPAHDGHLHISEVAIKRLGLDYVWWLVSPQNPLKPSIGMAPLADRLAYAASKFENNRRIFVVDLERDLGTRYTIDTLTKLKRRFPQVQFVWLMGSDNLKSFRRWRRWQDIMKTVPVAVIMRPGSTLTPLHAKPAQRLAGKRCDATSLRRRGRLQVPCLTVIDGPRNASSSTKIRGKTSWADLLVGAIAPC